MFNRGTIFSELNRKVIILFLSCSWKRDAITQSKRSHDWCNKRVLWWL